MRLCMRAAHVSCKMLVTLRPSLSDDHPEEWNALPVDLCAGAKEVGDFSDLWTGVLVMEMAFPMKIAVFVDAATMIVVFCSIEVCFVDHKTDLGRKSQEVEFSVVRVTVHH